MKQMIFPPLFPVVTSSLWPKLRERIKRPPISHTRRVGLLYEQRVPDIRVLHHPQTGYNRKTHLYFVMTPAKNLTCFIREVCEQCLSRDIRINVREGIGVCARCGYVVEEIIGNETSYTQTFGPAVSIKLGPAILPRSFTHSHYKRRNHFKNWLARIQGKETNPITKEELSLIHARAKGCHDYESLRQTLKSLGLQRYYNHVYYIIRRFTGSALVDLTSSHEQQLLDLFIRIQEPFGRHCGQRVNMLNYCYLLRKFTELLGWEDMAYSLPHLKSAAKLHQQDLLWKRICGDLQLRFTRSV